MLYEIRPLEQKDAKNLSLLHQKCFKDYWDVKTIYCFLEQGGYGFCCDYGFIFLLQNDILTFCVEQGMRQKNIGFLLLQKTLQATSFELFLEVELNNKAALKLYQSFGFGVQGIRKNYYAQDQHAFLMGYFP